MTKTRTYKKKRVLKKSRKTKTRRKYNKKGGWGREQKGRSVPTFDNTKKNTPKPITFEHFNSFGQPIPIVPKPITFVHVNSLGRPIPPVPNRPPKVQMKTLQPSMQGNIANSQVLPLVTNNQKKKALQQIWGNQRVLPKRTKRTTQVM